MAQTSEATPTAFPLGSTTVLQLQASNGSSTSSRSKQQLRAHPQSTKSRLVSIPRTTARSALAGLAAQPPAGTRTPPDFFSVVAAGNAAPGTSLNIVGTTTH